MVAVSRSLLALTLAASSCLAAPQPQLPSDHALMKRLFGLSNLFGGSDSTTTTSTTTSSSSTTTSSSVKTTSTSIATTSSSIKTTSATSTTSSSTSTTISSTSTSASSSIKTTSSVTSTSSTKISTSAAAAATDTLVFSGLSYIVSGSDKISTNTLSSYSVSACSALCAANDACDFYNIYYAATIFSLIVGTTPYCALYSNTHTAADATDSGSSSLLTYSNSAGYILAGSNPVSSSSSSVKSSTVSSTAAITSSSSAKVSTTTSVAATSTTTSANALAAAQNLVASVTSSAIALPTTSLVKVTSVVVPSTSVAVATTSVAVSIPTTIAVSTSVSLPVSVTVSSSAVCALPTWAYSGWCNTLPSMVPNMVSNIAKSTSLNKGYIIPLYIYPSWWLSPGAWDWVFTAAANYPSITFTVIINPNSGPGTTAVPNTDYQYELQKMAAVSNIVMLGYVDTAFGSRSQSAVSNDISVYAGWGTSNSALTLDGIFFDNQASSSSYLSMYQAYAAQVRSSGFSGGIVGMAPGQICDPSFIDVADFTVIFEDASSAVQSDIFGWYASFLNGLSTSQLQKIVLMISSADSTTSLAVSNIQAALNPKYIYMTDNTGSWGAAFQSAPSAAFLTKALNLISAPLSQVAGLVGT